MRTETIKLYKFDELSDEAKERALRDYQDQEDTGTSWQEENFDSIVKGCEHFGFKLNNYSFSYYNASFATFDLEFVESNTPYWIGDPQEPEMAGKRLKKYLDNSGRLNYWNTHRKQNAYLLAGYCPFTGYCADEIFLDPIREFVESPDGRTFQELIEDCCAKVFRYMESDYDYQMSEQYFAEECDANEYEFTEDGKLI